jgi:hypothetical protein
VPTVASIGGDTACEWYEHAFTGDKSEFIRAKVRSADTIVYSLEREGTAVATLNNNTYGTYFNLTSKKYVGFLVDWTKVFNVFGGGYYKIKITKTIFGQVITEYSRMFYLVKYDDRIAHDTVWLEFEQDGNIVGNEIDFTGLEWYGAMRFSGDFGNNNPEIEVDNYENSTYEIVQNNSRVRNRYEIELRGVPADIWQRVCTEIVLANQFWITAYNRFSRQKWEHFPVIIDSFSNVEHFADKTISAKIIVKDKIDSYIKRNF